MKRGLVEIDFMKKIKRYLNKNRKILSSWSKRIGRNRFHEKRSKIIRVNWFKIEKFLLHEAIRELVEIDLMKRGQKSIQVIDFKSKNSYFLSS